MDLRAFSTEELKKEIINRTSNMACVDLCHAHFCLSDHNTSCEYYHERQRFECWDLPAHQNWLKKTQEYQEQYGMDPEELVKAFGEIVPLLELYMKLNAPTRVLFNDVADLNT